MAFSRAQGVLDELKALFGPRALLSRAAKEVYRYDAILVGPEPLAVVLPESREEVAALKIAGVFYLRGASNETRRA